LTLKQAAPLQSRICTAGEEEALYPT